MLTINDGTSFLATDESGDIAVGTEQGLYHDDLRFLSDYQLRLDGATPVLLSARTLCHHTSVHYFTNPELVGAPSGTLSLARRRMVGRGMHEDLDLTNYGDSDARLTLEITFDSDFAHIFDVKRQLERATDRATERRRLRRSPRVRRQFAFASGRGHAMRRTVITLSQGGTLDGRTARLELRLPAGGSWHLCLDCRVGMGNDEAPPRYSCKPIGPVSLPTEAHARRLDSVAAQAPRVQSDHAPVTQAYDQAVSDLAALRIPGEQLAGEEWVLSAGIPWYLALFGRDALIAGFEALPFQPEYATAALRALARRQGTAVDPVTDEAPGKILHEHRFGQQARPVFSPRFPYYGTVDATPLFLVLLSETYRWTGDLALVEELRGNVIQALEWIDAYGDSDGDGYVEYYRTTPGGLTNQGWKDSWDSVRFHDGVVASGPIALCEVQGYVYDAKMRTAELFDALDEPARATVLRAQAGALRSKFNRDFWIESRGYYAEALDGAKRPVDSLTSNAGHLLWSGIADADKARRVAARLLSPALFTGWGIRTMGSQEGGYNPISYHNGSVWPHDTALIAAGLARYGYVQEAARVVGGLLDSVEQFPNHRVPELFAGFDRLETGFPVDYPTSSSPQAWAAGSVLLAIRTMLGVRTSATGLLSARPLLPAHVSWLRMNGVRLRGEVVDLEVHRTGEGARLQVHRTQQLTRVA
ncbi:MAG: amylo-alpha-1,6-glucosidase [Chloroflexi bacterium]|nr:amylo-alpha-1,6-glucosidase [Chloroflexota bacterium]